MAYDATDESGPDERDAPEMKGAADASAIAWGLGGRWLATSRARYGRKSAILPRGLGRLAAMRPSNKCFFSS
jgi:hypothetical protein